MSTEAGLKDVRQILSLSSAYALFRRMTGSDRLNKIMFDDYVRLERGHRILDLGCGPGMVLENIPEDLDVDYVGLDVSKSYTETAQRKHGHRARFITAKIEDLSAWDLSGFDIVICFGVLHHLCDEATLSMLEKMKQHMRSGGRFVSYDPAFKDNQNVLAALIHSLDRGRFVRHHLTLENLVKKVLPDAHFTLREDLTYVPSTAVISEWVKP